MVTQGNSNGGRVILSRRVDPSWADHETQKELLTHNTGVYQGIRRTPNIRLDSQYERVLNLMLEAFNYTCQTCLNITA